MKTIQQPVTIEIPPIKRSRFISDVSKVSSETEVFEQLALLKKRYPGANHHCWAYALANHKIRFNDDGEPAGSAGKPILNHITGADLTNVLVVVIRYFGGTKLGVGGLIRAYLQAASSALASAGCQQIYEMNTFHIRYAYTQQANVQRTLEAFSVEIIEQNYTDQITQLIGISQDESELLLEKLQTLCKGNIYIEQQ